jgi:hypothetical protein
MAGNNAAFVHVLKWTYQRVVDGVVAKFIARADI